MRIAVYRQKETPLSTQGELFCDGTHNCWTLERPSPQYPSEYHRIPAGSYKVSIYPSPHFSRLMPLLRDVPGHSYIEIHFGNSPTSSKGCILVGKQKSDDALWHTREAFNELFPLIQNAVEQSVEGCFIDVIDPPLSNHDDVNSAITAD